MQNIQMINDVFVYKIFPGSFLVYHALVCGNALILSHNSGSIAMLEEIACNKMLKVCKEFAYY